MIKTIKQISLIMCGLLIYSFIGGLTYSVHEHFYPGSDVLMKISDSPKRNGSKYVAVGWPAGLPIWGGIKVVKILINLGMSTGEELTNEQSKQTNLKFTENNSE